MNDNLNPRRVNEDTRKTLILQIRKMVADNTLSYTWLIQKLSDKGLLTDKFEMSATMAGTRRGQKADDILCHAYAVLCEYEAQASRAGA